jgi:hypothetical protein
MLSLRLRQDKIDDIEQFNLAYHPDLILYDLKETQYNKIWRSIKNYPKSRLYADGIIIKPVSWLGALFQKIKGWFGFDNHCELNKVEITLAKIAYYGYLKGFNTKGINYPEPIISHSFLNLVKAKRTNENSAALQSHLLSYYRRNEQFFPEAYSRITEHYPFGQTLLDLKLYAHIPTLDPQNASVIRETISSLTSADGIEHLPESTFAESFAHNLVSHRYFEEALQWSPAIYKHYKKEFIEFYLSKGAKNTGARTQAVKIIIELLDSSEVGEHFHGYNFLRGSLSLTEQLHYLEPYPKYRAHLIKAYREQFIEYYLSQAPGDTPSRVKAIELIIELANSLSPKHQQKALKYLKERFSYQEQLYFLQSSPAIKEKLAQCYLEDALKIKNKYAITKLIGDLLTTGNATPLNLVGHAITLNPKLFEGSFSSEFLPLKEEWIHHLFNEAILLKRFLEADALFIQNQSFFKLNANKLTVLRDYYLQQLTVKSQNIKTALEHKQMEEGEQEALDAIELGKKVARITPNDHPVIKTILQYVNTVTTIDEMKHIHIDKADIAVLNKMSSLLNEYSTMNLSAELNTTRNRVLLRQIDYFIEQVKGPSGFGNQWKERTAFAKEHRSELTELQKLLTRYIKLNEKDKNKEIRSQVAKMHYTLGDIFVFFFDNNKDALEHFTEAARIMDKNPYYQLRPLELTHDDKRHQVLESIAEISTYSAQEYNFWLEERWDKGEKTISRGVDIHDVEVAKKGFFALLGL